jgi:hypothetical protein
MFCQAGVHRCDTHTHTHAHMHHTQHWYESLFIHSFDEQSRGRRGKATSTRSSSATTLSSSAVAGVLLLDRRPHRMTHHRQWRIHCEDDASARKVLETKKRTTRQPPRMVTPSSIPVECQPYLPICVLLRSNLRKGALFLAVYRGKVSEGIDFSDDNARGVVSFSPPYTSQSLSLSRACVACVCGMILTLETIAVGIPFPNLCVPSSTHSGQCTGD